MAQNTALLRELDHVFTVVTDLDTSAEKYRRLGFQLTPRGTHSGNLGTANYCIMFERTYFELLGIVTATEFNKLYRQFAAQPDAVRGIAYKAHDAEEIAGRRRQEGLPGQEAVYYSRPVPDLGNDIVAEFAGVLGLADIEPIGAITFASQHLTPEFVWRPEWMSHPNGVKDILGLWVVSPAPEQTAEEFAKISGASSIKQSGSVTNCVLNNANIFITSPANWRRRFPEFALANYSGRPTVVACIFAVDNLDDASACLDQHGRPFHIHDDALWTQVSTPDGLWLAFKVCE